MWGGRYEWTHTHTHIHTYTQDNYSNPRCACAPRVNENDMAPMCKTSSTINTYCASTVCTKNLPLPVRTTERPVLFHCSLSVQDGSRSVPISSNLRSKSVCISRLFWIHFFIYFRVRNQLLRMEVYNYYSLLKSMHAGQQFACCSKKNTISIHTPPPDTDSFNDHITFHSITHFAYVSFHSCSFRLSHSTALQVISSTLNLL